VGSTHEHEPLEENIEIYQDLVNMYIRVSRSLENDYEVMADFQKKWVK
jgi:gluconokinase